ncbi:hypothetical protein MHY1_00350 [Methylovirgula sp. HY1]|nr:hypothetical protein MHY1_00350 [Methylovirgula sp. HY1]
MADDTVCQPCTGKQYGFSKCQNFNAYASPRRGGERQNGKAWAELCGRRRCGRVRGRDAVPRRILKRHELCQKC